MSAPQPRPGVMSIEPYVGGESAIKGAADVIKLSSNEGAFGPSPLAQEAYASLSASLHRYPDGGCHALRQAIAETYNLDADRIVCGSGSDEIISLLCSAYAGPGDEVLYSEHGFLMYPISAKAVGATPVTAPETNLTANVDALISAANETTKILFLANPNNPTGTFLPSDELVRLRAELPDHVLMVIDAAYAEYVDRPDYTAGADFADFHDNVVMTRTFSKIHALGGMRLGWGYGPAEVVDVLNRVRGPFNVNGPAMAAGVAALGDAAFTEKVRRHNDQWLAWTRKQVLALGLNAPDGVGNFLLVQFPSDGIHDAEKADAFLKDNNIIVRRMAGYGLPDCLRITIGLEEEMRAVIDALARFLGRNT